MATQEKLQKSLEFLKNASKFSSDPSKKKEKIQHCYIVTDAISNPTIRISTNFYHMLGSSIETFLQLCDDQDTDIRMTSEECLCRIIRASNDGCIGKIQIELHKEIKKNGSAKSLRAALWLFASLTHHIRPHKGKPYVTNIFPSLIKITERTEESVHETLAVSLPKILKVLGCFTMENEMKALLKSFLLRVSDDSATIRRTTNTCIISICLNCRKQSTFLSYCLNYILDLLIPVNREQTVFLILGAIGCIKSLVPKIKNSESSESHTEKLLQVFELCLYFLSHEDHNIVNLCLETLKILIQNANEDLKQMLLNENGLGYHRIYSKNKFTTSKPRSPSTLSIATTMTPDENLFSESELTETVHSDIERWINESKLTVFNTVVDRTRIPTALPNSNINSEINKSGDLCDYPKLNELNTSSFGNKLKAHSVGDNLDNLTVSENSSEKSYSASTEDQTFNFEDEQDIDIGDIMDCNIPLIYCTRLITKKFLLKGIPGATISDKMVRVSVKHLAIACLSAVFELYPVGIFLHLDKNYLKTASPKHKNSQTVSNMLLYRKHQDPQLRGAVRSLLANFIQTVTILAEESYDKWIIQHVNTREEQEILCDNLIKIFIEGLEDESSGCVRQTLISLDTALKFLCESEQAIKIPQLLNVLPLLSVCPYWLVKVSLCDLTSKIDYSTIFYITNNSSFQDKVIYNVFFELLGDSDQRVRTSAASSIVSVIPHLYFKDYRVKEDVVISKAIVQTTDLQNILENAEIETNVNKKHFIRQMPFPFCEISNQGCDKTSFSLSRILYKLSNIIITSTSKYQISGCIETLYLLSKAYPTTVYKSSWNNLNLNEVSSEKSTIPDLLKLCINFLLDTNYVYDLQVHINLLNLSANLYAGHSLTSLVSRIDEGNSADLWQMVANQSFQDISERYLEHVFKLLNIFHHVVNQTIPIHSQSKTVLPNLPTNSTLSPVKRRKSDLDRKMLTIGKLEKEEKIEKKENVKQCVIGVFSNSSRYMKIFDIVKGAFINYKISLNFESSEKFLDLLNGILHSLSVLMEIGSLTEFSRIADEMLTHLHSVFLIDAPKTVKTVQQLLKCLFSTNLAANITEFREKVHEQEEETEGGFYHNIFKKKYSIIVHSISELNQATRDIDDDSTLMGYLHRKDIKRRSILLSRSSDKILANYIRIFEPVVIKSLKQYTITSDVNLQCEVLQLLGQLVQLRVNYCLLDSEQVFIGFVLKQFDFIEEGQIPSAQYLVPKIFQFLVQLSYSKQHSKCIIGIPKIIQLCDGLMASGQPSKTHCVPALEPIVEDIFLTRNKSNTSDSKELETTREVVLSMLLRLWEHEKVMDLITLILEDSKFCTDDSEKWYEWSKTVFSAILPMFKQNKVKLDRPELFAAMKRLLYSLNPEVFQPYDHIIVLCFQEPPNVSDISCFNTWLSKIFLLLQIIISINEETLLSKINTLKVDFSPASIYENIIPKTDPLNVNNNADAFHKIPPEQIFIRLLFRVISLISRKCLWTVKHERNDFLISQFSGFLLQCSYLLQSGNHYKIAKTIMSMFNKNTSVEERDIQLNNINSCFVKLSPFYPTLTFYWCYLLTLINSGEQNMYSKCLEFDDNSVYAERLTCSSVNMEITRIGILISLCDYLVENLTDSEYISWFLSKNSKFLVDLCDEPPVSELITSLHRHSSLSNIFLKHIAEIVTSINSSMYKLRLLKCIEDSHVTQIGTILKLLIPSLLKSPQVAIARKAANLASRKIEILLTLPMEDVSNQLTKEDLMEIQKSLVTLNLVQKYETLVSFLNKLATQYYDLTPIEFEQRRVVNPDYIRKLKINKKWYVSQIQARYNDENVGKETAELLSQLEYNEISSFMSSSMFNKLCLKECLKITSKNEKYFFGGQSDITKASIECLWKDINSICTRIPDVQQVVLDGDTYSIGRTDSDNLKKLFQNEEFLVVFHSIAPCIPLLLSKSSLNDISNTNLENLMKFGVLSLEYINYLMDADLNSFSVNTVDTFLNSTNEIFKQDQINRLLELENNIIYFCITINSLTHLVTSLLANDQPLPTVSNVVFKDSDNVSVTYSVHNLYILVCWLCKLKSVNTTKIPSFLYEPIQSLIISLSRLSSAYSYVVVPSKAWKNRWIPETFSGIFKTQIPPLPIDLLQDVEILEEYIFRINLLGWTSRQQFEETWMCLLSVLCCPTEDTDPLDLNDILHCSSLATKSITALLLKTLTCYNAGNPNLSKLLHISRNVPLSDDSVSIKKLKVIQGIIQQSYSECSDINRIEIPNIFEPYNFEKLSKSYSYGQVSIKYFLTVTNIIKETEDNSLAVHICRKRGKMLEDNGLDVNSCLQFLLDYYTQLMKPQASTHIRVLHEAIRSTVIISDLFTDKSQFSWMLDTFLELSKLHAVEDELLHQYLIIGISKAVGVLTPELEVYEQVKKLLVQYLKSPYLSSRIACLYGLLYVLEGCKLSNISIGNISDEMQLILPCAVEYVQSNIQTNNSILRRSQKHSSLLWSLAFYLIENIEEMHMEHNFVSNCLTTAFSVLSTKMTGVLHLSIMEGLQRLLLVKKRSIIESFGTQYLKLALEKIKSDNPTVSLLGTQLLLSYMYTDFEDHIQIVSNSSNMPTSPEHLVQTIEKISALFERIKKGYVFEVEILCSVLPNILDDFFSPSDILTKVIGEFLSSQQPHPKLLSRVVFQVFQSAINRDQLSLLRDWVVFSLSNFTQSFSVNMATWCLTCFFISASSNGWLRAYFPYVQTRVGRYEYEDKKMLCIAGADFYNSLTSDKQKETFIETFKKVRDQPGTPFNDLLLSL